MDKATTTAVAPEGPITINHCPLPLTEPPRYSSEGQGAPIGPIRSVPIFNGGRYPDLMVGKALVRSSDIPFNGIEYPISPPRFDASVEEIQGYLNCLAVRAREGWALVRDSLKRSGFSDARYHAIPGVPIELSPVDQLPPGDPCSGVLRDKYYAATCRTVIYIAPNPNDPATAYWSDFDWSQLCEEWGFDISLGPVRARAQKFYTGPNPYTSYVEPSVNREWVSAH